MPNYQSFSGSDIVATFGGRPIGELLSITWSVSREKAPNYTMGSAVPRGFARGRRGIAGSLVFAVFDRNALLDEMRKGAEDRKGRDVMQFQKYKSEGLYTESNDGGADIWQPEPFNEAMSRVSNNGDLLQSGVGWNDNIEYADQILPFNIVINAANETGAKAKITLVDVEILNQGSGISIQDLAISQNYTFVARDIEEISKIDSNGTKSDTPSYGPTHTA